MTNCPKLKQKLEVKKYHGYELKDEFSWTHQKNILEVLKDSSKLLPDVRKYLEEENAFTEHHLKSTKDIQKKLFDEIKGRIKLDDESLHFFYKKDGWEYWSKTTKENNYSIQLRKKIGDSNDKMISKFRTPFASFLLLVLLIQVKNKKTMIKIIIPVTTIFI